jgi:hypothetical protein
MSFFGPLSARPGDSPRAGSLLLLRCAAVTLLALASLKVYAWQVPGLVSNRPDVVTGVPMNIMVMIMAILELVFALVIGGVLRTPQGGRLLTCIGLGFTFYRALHGWKDAATCPCLAGTTRVLPFLRNYENSVLISLSIWFLLLGAWVWIDSAVENKETSELVAS